MNKFLNCTCMDRWADIAPFVLRVSLGFIFLMHGLQKWNAGLDGFTGMLTGLGFPMAGFFAMLVMWVEILGGLALILGFLTHIAAKLFIILALVALFCVHAPNGFFVQNGGYEFMLLMLAASISLMTTGAGKWSLDARMWKKDTPSPTGM